MINLDTGSALAFVSEGSPLRHLLKVRVGRSPLIMTQTAAAEFHQIVRTVGGPIEQIVPDNPSPRALGLRLTKTIETHDIIIFGTGDAVGAMTFTADSRFVRGAAAQGVNFNVFVHAPVPLTGV